MKKIPVFVAAFCLTFFLFSLAEAHEQFDEVPKYDGGEASPEKSYFERVSHPPTFPCTNDQPCPCLEGRCPYGSLCGENQQCAPLPCVAGECRRGFECVDGKCIGLTPCWGALCGKEEICVEQKNTPECHKLCGDRPCPENHLCVNKKCIEKESYCEQEGQTRECEFSCDSVSMKVKGEQLCSGGTWQICQRTSYCPHIDCFCQAQIYCERGRIYETSGGFRYGYQNRCWCEEPGSFVASCEGSCSKELEGKRFSIGEKTRQSLCSHHKVKNTDGSSTNETNGCGCQATFHPINLLSFFFFGVLLFLRRKKA
jgi:hypothetical protein